MCTHAALVNSLECYMDDLVDCFEEFVKKSLLVISVALGTIILMIMYVLKVLAERAANSHIIASDTETPLRSSKANFRVATTGWPNSTVLPRQPTDPDVLGKDPSIEYQDFQGEGITTTSKEVDTQLEEKDDSDTDFEDESESTKDANRFKKTDTITSNYLLSTNTQQSIAAQVVSRPSFDEKVLREIGLSSCSKPCNTSIRTLPNDDDSTPKPEPKTERNPTEQSCIAKHHLSDSRPCGKYIAIRTSCCSMCCVDDDRR